VLPHHPHQADAAEQGGSDGEVGPAAAEDAARLARGRRDVVEGHGADDRQGNRARRRLGHGIPPPRPLTPRPPPPRGPPPPRAPPSRRASHGPSTSARGPLRGGPTRGSRAGTRPTGRPPPTARRRPTRRSTRRTALPRPSRPAAAGSPTGGSSPARAR